MLKQQSRWIVAGVWVVLGLCAVRAQDNAAALERLYALGQEQGALSMPFTHRRYSALFKQPQTRDGIFHFDGGETAAMHYTTPEPYVFLIREGEALHLRPDRPKPEALDLRRAPLMGGLAQMFRLDPERLGKVFAVTARDTEDEGVVAVELVPLRSAPITRLLLRVDVQSGLLRQLRLDETSGDSQVIQFGAPLEYPPDPACFSSAYWMERLKEGAR